MNNRIWDSFLRGFGRSIGWKLGALVLLAVLGWFGMGNARAGDVAPCAYDAALGKSRCDQGMAYSNAYKHAQQYWDTKYCTSVGTWEKVSITVVAHSSVRYKAQVVCKRVSDGFQTMFSPSFEFLWSGSCAARGDLVGLSVTNFQGGSSICNFGCEYGQTTPQSDTTITDASNPQNSLRFGVLLGGKATGATCIREDNRDEPPKPDEPPPCLTIGQDSNGPILHCPKPDGGSCTISGKGTKFCQPPPPNTDGPKVDTGRTEGQSQSTNQGQQPQPPAERPGESWGPGPGSKVCNNLSGKCSETVVYGQTGIPNPNGSPIPGDGSGPGGAGQQEGSGSGSGGSGSGTDMGPTNSILDGIKGSIEGDDGAAGGFGAQVDGIGTGDETPPDDDTSDPFDGMKETRNSSWFLDQLDDAGFLGGGSCPSDHSVSVGGGSFQLSLAPLCQLLSAISGLVMAVAYIIAFRIMAT